MRQRKNITTNFRNSVSVIFAIFCAFQFFCLSLYAQQDASLFQAPIDFSIDTHARIYVTDSISLGGIFRFDDMTGKNPVEIGITCKRNSQECKLADPHTIFVDNKNRIYVSDATGRIVIMEPQKRSWNSLPSDGNVPQNIFVDAKGKIFATYDDGQVRMNSNCSEVPSFQNPQGIFVGADGQVYVAESGNDQIVRMNSECKIEKFGEKGSGQNQFDQPSSIYVDTKGRIYVSDTGNHRIVRMDDFSGRGWVTFGKFGESDGELRYPHKVLVDAQNRIYVGDYGNGRIVQIDPNSNSWTILSLRNRKQEFSSPADVSVDNKGRIYVADEADKRIVRVDSMNGDGWTNWQGIPPEKLQQPVSIFSHNDKLYVTDSERRSILELNDFFQKTRELSTKDFFVRPDALFVDTTGQIFLTDLHDHAIGRFDDMADPKKKEIFWGKDKQSFDHPSGIFVDGNNRIYVADTLNQRIVRMDDLQGTNWTELPLSKKNVSPVDISLDSRGRVYILDGDGGRIIRVNDLSASGWIQFGTEGSGRNQFYHPSAISLDSQDRVFVADTGNQRIVRIDNLSGKGWVTLGQTHVPQIWLYPQN